MKEAVARLITLSEDEQLRMRLEAEDKHRRDQLAREDDARQEGIQEGRQEGRQEAVRATALKMLKEGAEVAFVEKCTGISRAEIEKLLEEAKRG